MADPQSLKRWLEQDGAIDDSVREIMRAAADPSVDDALMARLEARLLPLMAPPVSGPPPPAASAVGTATTKLLLLGFGAALLAGAVVAILLVPNPVDTPITKSASKPALQEMPADSDGPIEPAPDDETAEATAQATVAEETVHANIAEVTTPAERARQPRREVAAAPQPEPELAPEPAPSTFAEEAALLARAQAALNTNPARALQLTNQHRTNYPSGILIQERETLAIRSLRRLGHTEQAQHRSQAFQTRFPSSTYRSRPNSQ